jgi:transposase
MDGYQAYESTKAKLAGCSVYARRKFIEAEKAIPKGKAWKATLAISQISKLNVVERLGSQEDTAEYVLKVRQEHAPETVVNQKVWLEKLVQQVPPTSLLGKAI